VGKLIYGDSEIEIILDDRALAHIQIVIGSKLRRKEAFFFSWKDNPGEGTGRSAIWLDPAIVLYFRFSGSRPVTINRDWLEAFTSSADSAAGLMLTSEPGTSGAAAPTRRQDGNW